MVASCRFITASAGIYYIKSTFGTHFNMKNAIATSKG